MEIVNQIKGGRKKYAGGGKKAISSLQSDYSQKFQLMTPFVPLVPLPIRYETIPSHGLLSDGQGNSRKQSEYSSG